jgi:hypothetical protein
MIKARKLRQAWPPPLLKSIQPHNPSRKRHHNNGAATNIRTLQLELLRTSVFVIIKRIPPPPFKGDLPSRTRVRGQGAGV